MILSLISAQFYSDKLRRLCIYLHLPLLTNAAPTGDAAVRCEQLDLLLQWGTEFRQSSCQNPEGEKVLEDLVAFDVILGDLNFDNCSSGIRHKQQDSFSQKL